MDEKIAVLTDTNSGINPDQAAQYGIHLVSMPVIIDDETYFENESISQDEFFQRLREGACVSTSQPAPGVLMDCWEGLLERYEEIVYLPMSSGLSGGCQTAAMLAAEYGGSVHVVDNHRISVTLRQSVLEAKHLASQEKQPRKIAAYLEQDGLEASIYVAVNTLEYLKKSGRVTAAGAAIGTILNLKPVLQSQGGKLDADRKARGMRLAMPDHDRRTETRPDGTVRRAEADHPRRLFRGCRSRSRLAGRAAKGIPGNDHRAGSPAISISCHTGDGALGAGIMKDIF